MRFFGVLVLFAALCLGTGSAEAGKVPVPCTSEKIVTVMELPGVTSPLGQRVDLGYLYTGCFSGKWIGRIGNSQSYLTFKDGAQTPEIAALLPSEPGFFWGLRNAPGQFWVEWAWIVTIVLAGIGAFFQRRKTLPVEPVATATAEAPQPTASAAARAAPARAPVRAPSAQFGRAPAAGVVARSGPPSFGRKR